MIPYSYHGRKKEQDLFNAVGSMYAAVLYIGIQNSGCVQPVVVVERTVFYRERAAGMYSGFPYAFGQVISNWNKSILLSLNSLWSPNFTLNYEIIQVVYLNFQNMISCLDTLP